MILNENKPITYIELNVFIKQLSRFKYIHKQYPSNDIISGKIKKTIYLFLINKIQNTYFEKTITLLMFKMYYYRFVFQILYRKHDKNSFDCCGLPIRF